MAYKTIGTSLSQRMGHEDASGQTTDRCKAVDMQRYVKGRSSAVTNGPVISTYFRVGPSPRGQSPTRIGVTPPPMGWGFFATKQWPACVQMVTVTLSTVIHMLNAMEQTPMPSSSPTLVPHLPQAITPITLESRCLCTGGMSARPGRMPDSWQCPAAPALSVRSPFGASCAPVLRPYAP